MSSEMGKPTGFLDFERRSPRYRAVPVRIRDWHEVYEPQTETEISEQASRCMDCGIPFCMQGCPLGNRIPVFNDRAYRFQWDEAAKQLFATNNFPEFTGRLCPAPCESACVLGIASEPVTIERLEYEVAEHAFRNGYSISPRTEVESGKRVAIVGSGPAGLAAAAQLRSVGHSVTILERSDAIGGLLRYGIPEFKMEKAVLDRRLRIMEESGIRFLVNTTVGHGGIPLSELQRNYDAVILAIGSTRPRLIDVPGSDLIGVFPAMTYLEASTRAVHGGVTSEIDAHDLNVVILGGGDTGADCLGTAHRQGAKSVSQIEILPRPPLERTNDQPWPTMPRLFRTTSAHEEGGERIFESETLEFVGNGYVREIVLRNLDSGDIVRLPADIVLIAAGFVGPELSGLDLNLPQFMTPRGSISVGYDWLIEEAPGETPIFACGDAVRGQSLIVWAIAEGRSAAAAVDSYLRKEPSSLPSPVTPYESTW
jgi:glutamate synthase (NADPH) small chain